MRLECIKYEYSNLEDPQEINFFGTPEVPATIADSIDLVHYLQRNTLSDVEYTFQNIDVTDNVLYIEASSLTMQCRNSVMNQTTALQDFFEVYSNVNYYKWKLNYYDNVNQLIYTGIIYKDGAKFPTPRKSNLLNIHVVGYEREFTEYFKNKNLVSHTDLTELPHPLFSYHGLEIYNLSNVLQQNFPNVTIQNSIPFSTQYKVTNWGYTYAPSDIMLNCPFFHVKNGYRNFADAGVNRFDFFNGMLMAMGWVWYFYLGKLYIKRRYDLNLGIRTIDASLLADGDGVFISHGVESALINKRDVIIIEDGEYYENIGILGGNRAMYYSENFQYYNIQRPMRDITYDGTTQFYFNHYNGFSFSKVDSGDDRYFTAQRFDTGTNDPFLPSVNLNKYAYPTSKYVKIAPIINSREYANGLDYSNARANTGGYFGNGNFIQIANRTVITNHTFYRGNPANCLIKYEGASNKYRNYESYCYTQDFRNNFRTLLRSSASININAEIHELITNPFQNFKIVNYSYANNVTNKIFFLNKLGFNAQTGKTKLSLYTI